MAIAEDVLDFMAGRVDSVESLYVLLLLQRDPRLEWSGSAVGAELHIGAETADRQLAKLCSANLLEVRVGKDLLYRYAPRLAFLEQGAQALARAYALEPTEVVERIRPIRSSRSEGA